jgi:hypothetical protein
LAGAPDGTAPWQREAIEFDVRYNYGPNGIKADVPDDTEHMTPFQIAAAFGLFGDHVFGVDGKDRAGQYWYAEGLYNVTSKFYVALRGSEANLHDGATASLVDNNTSPIAVNEYDRIGIGLGWRLSNLIHLKTEYTFNTTHGGTSSPDLNQFAIGIASKF